ncbi:single-stranded DNA-binding protein [Rhodococcus sp. HNM0569]|uniref:single-stranded DNA-binding protein n=1 Tax=Rhodococcus sp. HNM0569 TaxID=2716340 RepID=UPI00146CB47F|nr:single-stranded DNA-binding protein [Rhodococcus sp. HNM0569]NLU83990.1 single-stranded DNA-binding protein [Rhodococcus sp. HNM0569]
MYETYTTVVGTVVTNPVKRHTASGEEVLSFRMASTVRRRDFASEEWVDGGTLYLTVTCWRRLVKGVGASIMKGDPVLAHGDLRTNEYTAKDGTPRADLEMRAVAVGPDLGRCAATLDRRPRTRVEPAGADGNSADDQQGPEAASAPADAA